MKSNTHKEIYEALQAVNARLDAVGEQLLIDLVEKVRTSLQQEQAALGGTMPMGTVGQTETTLKIWIEVDAAEPEDVTRKDGMECVGCLVKAAARNRHAEWCEKSQPAVKAPEPAWYDMRTSEEAAQDGRCEAGHGA